MANALYPEHQLTFIFSGVNRFDGRCQLKEFNLTRKYP